MVSFTLPGLLSALLLLLLPASLDHLPASQQREAEGGIGGGLHPIVLIPGVTCPDLEARLTEAYRPSTPRCGRMTGEGWFGLWTNRTWEMDPERAACFVDQMRLVYDPVLGEFRDLPGVETRVPGFGSARGFSSKDPPHPEYCLGALKSALERLGYHLRYAPPLPGQTSRVYSRYFRGLARLIEDASRRNNGKPAIVLGHSFGGGVALEFVRNTPLPWRDRFVKHVITVAPTWSGGGYVKSLMAVASGPVGLLFVPSAPQLAMRWMWRTFETAIVNLPSPAVFGRRPLVITRHRNYSAYDIADLLVAVGSADGVRPFRERELSKMEYFEAPMVPLTYINGVGIPTAEQLIYWDDDFDRLPEVVYGDGDDTINLASMLAFEEKVGKRPGQMERFKSIKLAGVRHSALVTDVGALSIIMNEIVEANR
ncbi:hypothetical protein PAHAL_9G546300 [Panicum hallii]|uniref:AB hydrolase-1 domain-containing protein n=1 Tax=Panicum hallii TaxID=206008 RepID=A0A2S3IST6_9POAL|nr:hypothetical protein PAHAL_9G546300 [Panicum hallii]